MINTCSSRHGLSIISNFQDIIIVKSSSLVSLCLLIKWSIFCSIQIHSEVNWFHLLCQVCPCMLELCLCKMNLCKTYVLFQVVSTASKLYFMTMFKLKQRLCVLFCALARDLFFCTVQTVSWMYFYQQIQPKLTLLLFRFSASYANFHKDNPFKDRENKFLWASLSILPRVILKIDNLESTEIYFKGRKYKMPKKFSPLTFSTYFYFEDSVFDLLLLLFVVFVSSEQKSVASTAHQLLSSTVLLGPVQMWLPLGWNFILF